MMKRVQTIILIAIAGLTLSVVSACRFSCVHGSGNQTSETRKVKDFTRLSISGGFKVNLTQDSSMSIKITADDNLLKYIKTENEGDRLHIYTRRNLCNTGEMTLNISVRNLEEIKAAGGVEIDGTGKINTKNLHIKLSGATKVNMDLTAADVTINGSGATELNLKGQATSNYIEMSGSGKVYALDFVVGSCNIQTSGVGYCEVNVLNSLSVHSSGASEVKYKGNPTVNNDKSGVSSIEKVN